MNNRTLYRPMFRRGGKVDSRGTGITSGLMPKRGFVDGPGGYAGLGNRGGMYNEIPFDPYQDGPLSTLETYLPSNRGRGNQPSNNTTQADINFIENAVPTMRKENEEFNKVLTNESGGGGGGLSSEFPFLSAKKENPETIDDLYDPDTLDDPNILDDPNNLEDLDDSRTRYEKIQETASEFEKMLGSSKKEDIFDMLTAAAPGLLADDYGAAIKAAGEVGKGSRKIKQDAKLLAIQDQLDKEKLEATTKASYKDPAKVNEYNFLTSKRGGGYSPKEAGEMVWGGGQNMNKEYTDQTQIARYTEAFSKENMGVHMRDNAAGYAQGTLLQNKYAIPSLKYEYDVNKQIENAAGKKILNKNFGKYVAVPPTSRIFFDPVSLYIKVYTGKKDKNGKQIVTRFSWQDASDAIALNAEVNKKKEE